MSQLLAQKDGAHIIAQPYIDGGRRIDMMAPYGATIAECVAQALPGLPEDLRETYARVFINGELVEPHFWPRARLTPRNDNLPVLFIQVLPGNRGALKAVLSIAVGVAALAIGQVWAGPLAGALGFGGSALATGIAQGALTGTTLLAGTFLINSLVPLRKDQAQGAGVASSPTYSIQGFRNVANPDGVVPCVMGKTRFAPPYAAQPYTETAGGETYIRALFLVGYGPVVIRDIRLGDTPIGNFKEVSLEVREGYPADTPVTLYPTQVLEERLTIDLNQAYVGTYGPHTRFTASDATEASVDITFPNGLFWMHTTVVGSTSTTSPLPLSVTIRIRMRLNGIGAWTTVADWPISAFTQKAISYSYRWALPARGRYEIEVTRLTSDLDELNAWQQNDQFVSVSLWSAIRSFRPEYPLNFNHPIAVIAVLARASKQLNGVIDNLNCEASRVCPDWDSGSGTWITRETQNPASLLRVAMQGPPMAYPLTDGEIDLNGLQDFHAYCAARGLTYNRVHDFEQSVFDTWSDIAAAGRASPRDDGERWGIVIDRAQTIVMQHITARNSWSLSGSREYIRFPHAFRVKFYDETNLYKVAERVVPWPTFYGFPTVIESIDIPGITNPVQIWKEARRRQYELIYRRDVYNVTQDFEGAVARRGDRVRLSHDVLRRTQISATVLVVSGNAVTLDELVTMDADKTYAIRFRSLPGSEADDLSILRTVETIEGEWSTVFLTGGGSLPSIGDLAMFGETGIETLDCLVREMEGAEDLARRFTLVDHAPQIEALADAESPPAWTGRNEAVFSEPVLAPSVPWIVKVTQALSISLSATLSIYVSCPDTAPVQYFEVQHRLFGAVSWNTVFVPASGSNIAIAAPYAIGDVVETRARAFGYGSVPLASAYSAITKYTVKSEGVSAPFGSGSSLDMSDPDNSQNQLLGWI